MTKRLRLPKLMLQLQLLEVAEMLPKLTLPHQLQRQMHQLLRPHQLLHQLQLRKLPLHQVVEVTRHQPQLQQLKKRLKRLRLHLLNLLLKVEMMELPLQLMRMTMRPNLWEVVK